MTDRELLERAAKAAGIDVLWTTAEGFPPMLASSIANTVPTWWNPLKDDGDALRLAVKLSLRVDVGWEKSTTVDWIGRRYNDPSGEVEQDFESDPYSATRRAIVLAAAAMVSE